MANVEFWHRRYVQQAVWTRALRAHLYCQCSLPSGSRILDAGCGTGALFKDPAQTFEARTFGVDIDFSSLVFAADTHTATVLACADVQRLPFAAHSFDLCYCHFLLLWLSDPLTGLKEMRRVTQPGGAVLVLAEPDYGGRIDYPPELEELGALQRDALRYQGADPCLGRRVHSLMKAAGFEGVETGLMGGSWNDTSYISENDLEGEVLEQDLKDSVPCDKILTLRQRDRQAWQNGERILFVPTFYSIGHIV